MRTPAPQQSFCALFKVFASVAAMLVPLMACSKLLPKRKVEVKTDTPQAAVASLMKLYANGEEARASEIFDPAMARIDERLATCPITSVSTSFGNLPGLFHCCERKLTGRDFTQTKLHAYLHDGNLSPKNCSIKNTWDYKPPNAGSFYTPYEFRPFLSDATCGDVRMWTRTDMAPADHDMFTFVEVACGEQTVTLVTRDTTAGSRVISVDKPTWGMLAAYESHDERLQTEQREQQRTDDLNKDLK